MPMVYWVAQLPTLVIEGGMVKYDFGWLNTYEVQIDFDKNSYKATKVDVTTNVWQTDATENALRTGKKVAYPKTTAENPGRYSERDRAKSSKDDEDKLETALKTGEEKAFYRRELEKWDGK